MDEPVFDLRIHEEPAWSYIGLVFYTSYSLFLFTASIVTGRKIYQDLYTTERVSLAHRRQKPPKTTMYKVMLMLCEFAIIFYFCADTSMAFTYVMKSDKGCYIQQTIAGTTYHAAKTFMYILFLSRLYMVYKPSAYAYNIKCIGTIGVILVIYGIILMSVMVIIWKSAVYPFDDIHKFPNYCDGTLEAITGGMIALEDMAVSAGFLSAFYIPLHKTIKNMNSSSKDLTKNKALFKIRYAGTKHTIITAVAMISTFFLVFSTVATDLNFLIGADPIINSICMMLMTPYFTDDKYYQRLCRLCILCCAKSHATYDHGKKAREEKELNDQPENTVQSKTNLTETAMTITLSTTNAKSVDTMDQLEKTAAQVNPNTPKNDEDYNEIP